LETEAHSLNFIFTAAIILAVASFAGQPDEIAGPWNSREFLKWDKVDCRTSARVLKINTSLTHDFSMFGLYPTLGFLGSILFSILPSFHVLHASVGMPTKVTTSATRLIGSGQVKNAMKTSLPASPI